VGLADRIKTLRRENLRIRRDCDDAWRRLRSIESFVERRLGFRLYLAKRDMTITRFEITPEAIEELISHQNGNNGKNGNGGNGNGNHGDGGNNRNVNPNENGRGAMPVARVCTYEDFMKCQPLNLKGTEGVVGLTRWFEKMETVFHISNCPEVYQVKYACKTHMKIP
ncbi:hypothetical protein Tco_0082890, partial [Tanacetum coccineum]